MWEWLFQKVSNPKSQLPLYNQPEASWLSADSCLGRVDPAAKQRGRCRRAPGTGELLRSDSARSLPGYLDGISPLLLRLGVCPPAPVLVRLLVGLLVIIAVLIICVEGTRVSVSYPGSSLSTGGRGARRGNGSRSRLGPMGRGQAQAGPVPWGRSRFQQVRTRTNAARSTANSLLAELGRRKMPAAPLGRRQNRTDSLSQILLETAMP